MPMTIDWNEAADGLKRDVDEHGGFLTIAEGSATRSDSASAACRGTTQKS